MVRNMLIALSSANPLLKRSSHLSSLLKYLYNHVFGNIRNVQAFLIKGPVKNTQHLITTLYIGPEELAHQFASLVYSKIRKMSPLGNFLACQINPSHLPDVEIIAANIKEPCTGRFLKHGYLLLPNVSFTLDLRESTDQIIKRLSRRRRRDVKKLQTFRYNHAISRNNERDFDFFYWKMYLPYAKKRFGKAAQLYNHSTLKATYNKNGGIIFVKKKTRKIAGILFQIREKTLYALSFGAYDGNKSLVADLAGQAVLFFLIKWAKTKGMKTLDYGKTMPFFRDGVFAYKKEWGMHMKQHADQPFCALKLNCQNEGVLSFLQQNPFIFLDKGVMKGTVLINHKPTKPELHQILSKHSVPRLDSLIVMAYHTHDTKAASETKSSTAHENLTDTLSQPFSNICLSLQKQGFTVEAHALEHQTCSSTNPIS